MYSQISANKTKTLVILMSFFVLIAGMSWIFAKVYRNDSILVYALAGSIIYALISYFSSARMALALNGAKEIQKRDNPELWNVVENISITNGIPMPKVYIINDPGLNAFATGRNPKKASVAITTGLLDTLERPELEGVMAHELGHIQNYDIRVSLIAFALVSVLSLLCDFFLRASWLGGMSDDDDGGGSPFQLLGLAAAIIAPLVAVLLQLALSRRREYLADATGALTTRYPEGLARALEKIQAHGSALQRQNSSTAHLFLANPLKGGFFSSIFSTHPPLQERIARLRQMGNTL